MIFKDLKAKIIFLFSVITYLISGLSALICNRSIPNWYGLLVGLLFTIFAFLFHHFAKKKSPLLYIVSCCINAIATGFSIGAYYSYTKSFLSILTVVLCFIPYFILTYLSCLLISKVKPKKKSGLILGLVLLFLFILCIIFWHNSTLFSFSFFTLLIVLFYFLLCLKTLGTPRNILSDLSFTSFGFYLLITFVVGVILSQGDVADRISHSGDVIASNAERKNKPFATTKSRMGGKKL